MVGGSKRVRAMACAIGWLAFGIVYSGTVRSADSPTIYRCAVNGAVVFADHPCDRAPSKVVELSPVNSYHAPAVAKSTHKTEARHPKGRARLRRTDDSIALEQLRAERQCRRWAEQLADIAEKMRTGYTIPEGERLKARQRRLEARRREERCK